MSARTRPCRVEVFSREVFPNLVQIGEYVRMGPRSRSSARSSALALFAELPECLLTIDRPSPALEIVVAAVERLADCGHFLELSAKGLLDDVLGDSSARRGEILQCLGRFGRDVHFHADTVRLRTPAALC